MGYLQWRPSWNPIWQPCDVIGDGTIWLAVPENLDVVTWMFLSVVEDIFFSKYGWRCMGYLQWRPSWNQIWQPCDVIGDGTIWLAVPKNLDVATWIMFLSVVEDIFFKIWLKVHGVSTVAAILKSNMAATWRHRWRHHLIGRTRKPRCSYLNYVSICCRRQLICKNVFAVILLKFLKIWETTKVWPWPLPLSRSSKVNS